MPLLCRISRPALIAGTDKVIAFKLSKPDILSLIADISDEFDISIPASEIIPENFNSVSALAAMVEKLS